MSNTDKEIKRATGLLVLEVVNSNINGNPDFDADPRQRATNGKGEVSPVSFKRKLRDIVEDHESPVFKEFCRKFEIKDEEHYCILESRGRNRSEIKKELEKPHRCEENSETVDDKEDNIQDNENTRSIQSTFLGSTFVHKYWDARVFGNTFLEEGGNKGFIKTGVVQFGMGLSIAPVNIIRQTNTNKAGVQENKNQGMAPLAYRVVEHGVYVMPFFVNPNFAHKSGCEVNDIELMKFLIPYAYDMNRSAIRPDVRVRHAWYIEHKSILGSCPDYLLLEKLTPKRKDNPDLPSTSWSDYVDVNKEDPLGDLKNRVESCVDLVVQ